MNANRVALITGATTGIGLATAIALSKAGYTIAITGPDAAGIAAAHEKLPANTVSVVGDLSDLSFVVSLAGEVTQKLGRVDLLVNNAAWRELLTMRDISSDSWERTLRICLTAPAFLAREIAVGMEQRKSGVIVNVSSIMAYRGFGVATAYIAAKAGLDALTRDLAVLYGPNGIRVFGIAPGAVDTALSADYASSEENPNETDMRKFSEQMIPAARWAKAEEIASAILALSSDEMKYLSGTTINLDGGWSAALYPRSFREQLTDRKQK